MQNVKEELLKEVQESGSELKCADLKWLFGYGDHENKNFRLKVGYSEAELEEFLKSIDFNYDNGYGSQEFEGYLWLKDGTWAERHEYDGSEWWEYKKLPEVPSYLV